MNYPLYEYSLCIALPLMIFFGVYFLLAPTPDRAIFANYLRSRRIMGVAILLRPPTMRCISSSGSGSTTSMQPS